jgi:hypothetical protein
MAVQAEYFTSLLKNMACKKEAFAAPNGYVKLYL